MNEEELKDGELLATADPITTEELDAAVLPTDPNQVLPSNTTGTKYPSAFGAKYGHSSVDLSIEQNEDKMLNEYNTWFIFKLFSAYCIKQNICFCHFY